jgi:hypothetical protein
VAHYRCGQTVTHIFDKQIGVNMKQSAFPISGSQYRHTEGMTLRDYFAAKAMQALIDNDGLFSEIPTQAYALADAMLKVRGE